MSTKKQGTPPPGPPLDLVGQSCRQCKVGVLEAGTVEETVQRDGVVAMLSGIPVELCRNCGDHLFRPGTSQTSIEILNLLLEMGGSPRRRGGIETVAQRLETADGVVVHDAEFEKWLNRELEPDSVYALCCPGHVKGRSGHAHEKPQPSPPPKPKVRAKAAPARKDQPV